MSRIDEALKRSAVNVGGPRPVEIDRGAGRAEAVLESYPQEDRAASPSRLAPSGQTQTRRSLGAPPETQPRMRVLEGDQAGKLVTSGDAPAIYVEQYRRLAAAMHELQVARGVKTLLLTSALPKEGKTLTTTNLALTLSESYERRVLLIDADLRRPTVHEVLQLPNTRGLTDALRTPGVELPLQRISAHLTVVPAGRAGNNPMAGLTSDRMKALLEKAAVDYDWVLIDSPPVGILPDAGLLAGLAQAILLVVAAGSTPYHLVQRAVGDLGRDLIVGTVMNRIEGHRIPATDYYGAYYGHDEARR